MDIQYFVYLFACFSQCVLAVRVCVYTRKLTNNKIKCKLNENQNSEKRNKTGRFSDIDAWWHGVYKYRKRLNRCVSNWLVFHVVLGQLCVRFVYYVIFVLFMAKDVLDSRLIHSLQPPPTRFVHNNRSRIFSTSIKCKFS